MSVYTRRLYAGIVAAPGWQYAYTVPSSGATVLRDVIFTSQSSTAPTLLELGIAPVPAGDMRVLFKFTAPPTSTIHVELRQMLLPDEQIWLQSDQAPYTVFLTGYHFS